MRSVEEKILPIVDKPYLQKNGRYYFNKQPPEHHPSNFDTDINRLKTFLKRWPIFYEFLRLFSPGISGFPFTARRAFQTAFAVGELKQRITINLGSGPRVIHPSIFNADIYPFANVDIIIDGEQLPFKDSSLDMVICESVLEHVGRRDLIINEIVRTIKPNGYLYVVVPFIYPYHDSPRDYFRWTKTGLEKDFASFTVIKAGVYAGPAAALQGVLMHLLAIPLSLGYNKLYIFWTNFFRFLLAPIKLLDFGLNFLPRAHEAAAVIYFFGQKRQ
ncbi:MAG: class I SAM-dependent methyltransferase [Patescibacteria group bacterium]